MPVDLELIRRAREGDKNARRALMAPVFEAGERLTRANAKADRLLRFDAGTLAPTEPDDRAPYSESGLRLPDLY